MASEADPKSLEELLRHSLELNKKYLGAGMNVLRHMSKSENVRKDLFRLTPGIYSRAMNSFAKMNLEYYNKMLEFGLSIADEFLRRGEGSETSTGPSFVLSGSGRPGEVVTLQFVLENTKSEQVQCELVSTAFIEENHPENIAGIQASFAPQSFVQQPGESNTVSISIHVLHNTRPGTYISDVNVVGFEPSYFSIVITVEPPQQSAHAKSKKRPTKKS
jgi:hypothetical protein